MIYDNVFVEQVLPIILNVLVVVVGLYILWVITSFIFAAVFKSQVDKGSKALNLFLNQRYDIMVSLMRVIRKYDVEIPKKDVDEINNLERVEDFQNFSKDERDERLLAFIHGTQNILALAERNPKILKDEEYDVLKTLLVDSENAYRQKVVQYNADVQGYNYWIAVFSTKFIHRIFKQKPKDLVI